jgi:(p)ppGpp synthase/HD superfamily hydrolase
MITPCAFEPQSRLVYCDTKRASKAELRENSRIRIQRDSLTEAVLALQKKHMKDKRENGSPYIIHPWSSKSPH